MLGRGGLTREGLIWATMTSKIKVREGRILEAIWSRWGDTYNMYEGCPLVLRDGNISALGVSCRRRENRVPARYQRDPSDHVCCTEGRSVALYVWVLPESAGT